MFTEELRELQGAADAAARRAILTRMRERARLRPDELRGWLARLQPDRAADADAVAAMVEALATRPEEWEPILLDLLDRVLALGTSGAEAAPIAALRAFLFLDATGRPQLREVLRVKYQSGLRAPSAAMRRACVDLLGGYRVAAHPDLLLALRALLDDPEWRVRSAVQWLLADEGLLPERYRPRIADRLRRVFLGKS